MRTLARIAVGLLARAVCAQVTTLVPNHTPVTSGAPFQRDVTHFTFDLTVNTFGVDWTASEISVDVLGEGEIWHDPGQRISESYGGEDPNAVGCYLHNLNSPGLPFNLLNLGRSVMYDTFFTGPGARFTTDPSFASPGPPRPSDGCFTWRPQPPPPLISTARRLRGLNPLGEEIPLAWFDPYRMPPLPNTVLARFTFRVPEGLGLSLVQDAAHAGVFATLVGRTTTALNYDGNPFSFTIYQAPEPTSLLIACAGALLASATRRRANPAA